MDKKKKNLQYLQVIHHQKTIQVVIFFYFQDKMGDLMVYFFMMDKSICRWITL